MLQRNDLIGVGVSVLISAILVIHNGPFAMLPIHWSATGTTTLRLPVWAFAVAYPILFAALIMVVRRAEGSRRLVGGSVTRTVALTTFILLSAQTLVLVSALQVPVSPVRTGAAILGIALAVAGNYLPKGFPPNELVILPGGTTTSFSRRRVGAALMLAGFAIALGAALI